MNSRRYHSITSSARASSDVGHVEAERPRGRRLMTNSNLVDCIDRQVGGLGALEDAAGVDAKLPKCFRQARPRSSSGRRLRQTRGT